MLADLPHWRHPARVLELARVAVLPRPGFAATWPGDLPRRRLRVLRPPLLELSSSAIRRRVGRGLSIRFLVPDAVARFIRAQGLYGAPRPAGRR